MKKRKDECLFCTSRKCVCRIVRQESPYYDEVSCVHHISDLEKHSDKVLGKGNGVQRWHLSGLSKYKRYEQI